MWIMVSIIFELACTLLQTLDEIEEIGVVHEQGSGSWWMSNAWRRM